MAQSIWQNGNGHRSSGVWIGAEVASVIGIPADVEFILWVLSAEWPQKNSGTWQLTR
jgi:hypothetical protein